MDVLPQHLNIMKPQRTAVFSQFNNPAVKKVYQHRHYLRSESTINIIETKNGSDIVHVFQL